MLSNTIEAKDDETLRLLYRVVRAVRASFQDMRDFADALHADLGVGAAARAVLEFLAEAGERTVPDIARAKNVSRQHIQQVADGLVAAGLAQYAANPAHRRSQLVRLTPQGERTFARMMEAERVHLAAIAADFAPGELDQALATLRRLRDRVGQRRQSL